MNKLDCDYLYWQILSLVFPPEISRDNLLYPIDPKARAKIAGYRAKKKPQYNQQNNVFEQ